MFTVNLPSVGICMCFDGDSWSVTEALQGDESIELSAATIPNASIAKFITYFRTMWGVACIKAKANPRVLDTEMPEFDEVHHKFWGFDKDHAHVVAALPFGKYLSYDDGEAEYTTDDILLLFYQCIAWTGRQNPQIIGAICNNYVPVYKVYLKANITDECVVYSSETEKWAVCSEKPEGTAVQTNVGTTAYIPEGEWKIPPQLVPLGFDLLADTVTGNYSTSLLATLPEELFARPVPANEFEQAFDLSTNAHRLLYYLNANPKMPEPVNATAPVVVERGKLPSVAFLTSGGAAPAAGAHPISCGGAVLIEGGHGVYAVYDIVNWLKRSTQDYLRFVERFDDSSISKSALNVFYERFGTYRTLKSPEVTSPTVPLQVTKALERWAWSDAGWSPIYGSDATYPDEISGVLDDLSAHYVDKDVDMNEDGWYRLLLQFLDTFMLPVSGLAALYYRTAEVPDNDEDGAAELSVVDPKTMTAAVYKNNGWSLTQVSSYNASTTKDSFGMYISCTGAPSISGSGFAKILSGLADAYKQLCTIRNERRDELCKATLFGDYDTLHICVPESSYNQRPHISTGVISDIDSPVILYDGKTRICHTKRGWAVNNIAGDKQKTVGSAGDYTIGYEPGNVEWGAESEQFVVDFINLVADYSDEDIRVARELATEF